MTFLSCHVLEISGLRVSWGVAVRLAVRNANPGGQRLERGCARFRPAAPGRPAVSLQNWVQVWAAVKAI